jgi:hypothetical protein
MTLLVVKNLRMVFRPFYLSKNTNVFFLIIGHYKIGVHIADVSYFVQEQTPLDNEAAQRTTSVYLVERVKSRFELFD